MRLFLPLAATLLASAAAPALSQTAPLSAEISSGFGSGFEASVSSGFGAGIESGLGSDTRRTMADGYFQGDRNAGALTGGGCAPTHINIDNAGCQPIETLRSYTPSPNRVTTYYGNGAMGPANTMPTYLGDNAMRLGGTSIDPNRPF